MADDLLAKAEANPAGLVRELADAALAAMATKHAAWDRYRRKVRNEWYLARDMRRPIYSTNYMHPKLETVKAYMTLQLPLPECVGTESSDEEVARALTTIVQWILDQTDWKQQCQRVIHNGEICGEGWFKVRLDTDPSGDNPRIVIESVMPENVLVDPKAARLEDARWVIHRVPGDDEPHAYRTEEQRAAAPGEIKTAYECYLRAPDGWRVILLRGNEVRYFPLPYDHGELPLVPYFPVQEDDTLHPPGMCEMIEPLQDLADALDEQIYRNVRLTVNRQRVLLAGSGLTVDDVDNTPGRVYVSNVQKPLEWDTPPSLPAELFAYRQQIEQRIDIVSGIYDVTQGKTSQGVTAYAAIATLQDASTRRIQMRLVNLAAAAQKVARQALRLFLQYFGPHAVIRIAGGPDLEILADYPEGVPKDPAERRAWRQQNGIAVVLSDVDDRYDIKVSADSALPASRGQRAQLAVQLFQLRDDHGPVIDAEALLDALDWPGREEILRRREERAQAQGGSMEAIAQLLGAAGGAGGQASPEGPTLSAPQSAPEVPGLIPPEGR